MSPWGTGAGSFFSSGISVTSASVATWIGHKPGRRRLWTRTDGLIGTPSATTPLPRPAAADEPGTVTHLSGCPCMHYCRAILTLLLTTGFVWHTQAAELVPVEERLKENLENRVLIFRETGIEGRHIRFDTTSPLSF